MCSKRVRYGHCGTIEAPKTINEKFIQVAFYYLIKLVVILCFSINSI